jgi:hypothetical protein
MGRFEDAFEVELTKLINQHNLENLANIPDYVIMHYFISCLTALNNVVQERDRFWDVDVLRDTKVFRNER